MSHKRIERDELNLRIAGLISLRATCKRGQVGCVITQDGRIIATGYNGSIIKGHCEELHCDLNVKCNQAMHAEANAICFAAKAGISLDGATLYCTTAPCENCARLIAQSGIKEVIYQNNYTDTKGIELLLSLNIKTIHYINE